MSKDAIVLRVEAVQQAVFVSSEPETKTRQDDKNGYHM